MNLIESKYVISPRDLIAELECDHRLHLEWAVLNKHASEPEKFNNEELELLSKHGQQHEEQLASKLKEDGNFYEVKNGLGDIATIQAGVAETFEAMKRGFQTIYKPTLFDGTFLGYPDFLVLARDSDGNPLLDDGRFVYDPVDAKSARNEKRAAVLQVAAYAFAMVQMGMPRPRMVHLWLANEHRWETAANDVIDLGEFFFNRVKEKIVAIKEAPNPDWSFPREACKRCRWEKHCESGRRKVDDISLIQGIRSITRSSLIEVGIKNLSDMANATDELRVAGKQDISIETFENLRLQARIQLRGRSNPDGIPIFEIKDPDGFGLIPQPSKGDIWFDMEGDPYAEMGEGLEYMFGYVIREGAGYKFDTFDAKNRVEERKAFGDFIDFVNHRRSQFPDLHIYHYASYEPSALLRLAQLHGYLEYEVDKLIREGVFVDLYSIVRKTLRFSTESLSIKKIEPIFYEGNRDKNVSSSIGSVVAFEGALENLKDGNFEKFQEKLDEIKDYNRDDCLSTQRLDQWIRDLAISNGINFSQARIAADEKWSEEEDSPKEPIALQLMNNVPIKREDRTESDQGKALLAAAIEYHRREDRPAWWDIFEKATSEISELENANNVVIPSKVEATDWIIEGKKLPRRKITFYGNEGVDLRHILDFEHIPQALYENAPDGFKEISGSTRGFRAVQIIELESNKVKVEERGLKGNSWHETPFALLPGAPIPTFVIQKVLRQEIGQRALELEAENLNPFPPSAHNDILLRRTPRQKSGQLPKLDSDVESVTQALLDCENSYVAVQGPPGTGKTYVGANVIVNLVNKGWRIGVVAQSHAVIENLLNSVRKIDPDVPIAKKGQSQNNRPTYHQDDVSAWTLNQSSGYVIGGTTWNFASAGLRALNLDLIVIDEAGQYSLANALVSISCARRALLLGDPQQLPHVSQGKHPEPIDNSVLKHVLGSYKTMPEHLGYFLSTTYRLHPSLAKPVSRLQYEDRLIADKRCSLRFMEDVIPGLHVFDVDHLGNTTKSIEEVVYLVQQVQTLLGKSWTETDKDGLPVSPRQIEESDILVIAAYNNQVRLIKQALQKEGLSKIKVGTIDKFQGQEAALVLISMATSSSEDLPRGIEFLLSPNRINVAVSRAKWACYLIRSPQLSVMEPNSADGMVMLGKFITLCKSEATN